MAKVFTACVASAENTAVLVRATEEEVKEVVNNQHLDLILKDVFTGTSEMRTIQVEDYELIVDDIEHVNYFNPFYLYIPLTGGHLILGDIINALPEGWKRDDPCITTHDPNEDDYTYDDCIINLRTEEIVFFMVPDYVARVSNMIPPHLSGEAQLIFSMFVTNLDTDCLLELYKEPFPSGIEWYEEFKKGDVSNTTSFFSKTRSTIATLDRGLRKRLAGGGPSVTLDRDSAVNIWRTAPALIEYFCKRQKRDMEKESN